MIWRGRSCAGRCAKRKPRTLDLDRAAKLRVARLRRGFVIHGCSGPATAMAATGVLLIMRVRKTGPQPDCEIDRRFCLGHDGDVAGHTRLHLERPWGLQPSGPFLFVGRQVMCRPPCTARGRAFPEWSRALLRWRVRSAWSGAFQGQQATLMSRISRGHDRSAPAMCPECAAPPSGAHGFQMLAGDL